MNRNQKTDAYNADIPPAIFAWEANASTATAGVQNIPKSGLASSDTATVGQLAGRPQSVLTHVRARFVGDVANVAGQTINFAIIVLSAAGVTTTYANLLGASPLATTAGVKDSGEVALATPINIAAGDYVRATLTPSAGLTAVVTNVAFDAY